MQPAREIPYLTLSALVVAAAQPFINPFGLRYLWPTSIALALLACYRLTRRYPVPLDVTLMASAFVVSAALYLRTSNLEDLRQPLTEAAFFYVVGGCGFENRNPKTIRWVVLLLSLLTLGQAFGVVSRYALDPYSQTRNTWNLVGLFASMGCVGFMLGIPRPVPTLGVLSSALLVLASGARNAVLFTLVGGVTSYLCRTRGSRLKTNLALIVLALAIGVAFRYTSVIELIPVHRFERSVTFDDAHREFEWTYYLNLALEHPFGLGFHSIWLERHPTSDHNGWLDLWTRGGIIPLGMFLIAQALMFARLYRTRRASPLHATALALFLATTARMVFEGLIFGTSSGMNVFLALYCIGAAQLPRTAPGRRLWRKSVAGETARPTLAQVVDSPCGAGGSACVPELNGTFTTGS